MIQNLLPWFPTPLVRSKCKGGSDQKPFLTLEAIADSVIKQIAGGGGIPRLSGQSFS